MTMPRRRPAENEDVIVLDSIGSPALSFAVPAALRLLSTPINEIRKDRPTLRVVTGDPHALGSHLPSQQ